MKVCFLITGLLRNFTETFYPFLLELQDYMDFDMYVYTSNENLDTNYINFKQTAYKKEILENPRCKLFIFDNAIIPNIEYYREREKNIFNQWYKLYKCFQYIQEVQYDIVIRIRPDIKCLISPKSFAELISNCKGNHIYIPEGNDRAEKKGINDQLAIGDYNSMSIYCNTYLYLQEKALQPLISETILQTYLQEKQVSIQRINLPYSLYLSDCIVLAITGDSGVGKSTILESIQRIFPFDSSLTLETDRYHKWERSDENWKRITHLHPEANHLEKLVDDTFHLKLGDTVCVVDYDHSSGKFTAPQSLQPKQFLLLCGLHSLAKEKLRKEIDIRIYVDTEVTLKKYWKVRRDLEKRNRSLESILESIEKRESDYKNFIEPQKQHANIILHYWYNDEVPPYDIPLEVNKIKLNIECHLSLLTYVSHILYHFSTNRYKTGENTMIFHIKSNITQEDLLQFIEKENIPLSSPEILDASYLGICQLLILCLLT